MALVKYNNNSISAVTSAAAIPSGALVPIKTLTASSSSTVSFVHGSSDVVLDSTYPIYVFKFINIHPSAHNAAATGGLNFNASIDTGSNYNVAKTSSAFTAYHAEDAAGAGLGYNTTNDAAQQTTAIPLSGQIYTDADSSLSGEMFLFNPSSTTFVKHFIAKTHIYYSGDYSYVTNIAGYFNTTSAIDEIQFKMSSGDIDAGTIQLFGIL